MKTDRSKRPKCRYCGRTIVTKGAGWQHKHTGKTACTGKPRVATPPAGFNIRSNCPLSKAIREGIVRLARKGLDVEQITRRLNESGSDWPDVSEEEVQEELEHLDRVVDTDWTVALQLLLECQYMLNRIPGAKIEPKRGFRDTHELAAAINNFLGITQS